MALHDSQVKLGMQSLYHPREKKNEHSTLQTRDYRIKHKRANLTEQGCFEQCGIDLRVKDKKQTKHSKKTLYFCAMHMTKPLWILPSTTFGTTTKACLIEH